MLRTPTGGAGNGTATADDRPMSIGTVLLQLRDEFPEVTISKIRFLEAEGLVEPQRTPSGYRKFRPDDVERLAQVLRMQRDHYLPLKVIREHLDAVARGERAPCRPRTVSGTSPTAAGPAGRAGPPPPASAGPSCSLPRRSPRATSTRGSRTVWSCRRPTADTTPRRSPSPGSWRIWAGSVWNRGICAPCGRPRTGRPG